MWRNEYRRPRDWTVLWTVAFFGALLLAVLLPALYYLNRS
jgi:hypothetical protein